MKEDNKELTLPTSVVEFPLDKPDNTYNFTGKGIVIRLTRKISIIEFYEFKDINNEDYLELLLERNQKGMFIKRFPSWRLVECKADYSGSYVYHRFEEKDNKWISSLELLAMPIERSPDWHKLWIPNVED